MESQLYGVLQRLFLTVPKQCDLVVGKLLGELLPGREKVRVLDVGCGNGQCLRLLHDLFPAWTFTGFDLRPEAVAESGGKVELADLFGYDPGGLLDVIVCQNVTYSFTDEEFSRALENFRGWLPVGGVVVLFDMFTPWEQHLTIVERSLHHRDGHPLTVRPYSQLRAFATFADLEVLEIRPFTYTGGSHWTDPHDLRSYNEGGMTMRGCFNQTQAHAVLVAT